MAAKDDYIVFHDTIMVPTDFSEVCNNAVDYAAQMAKSLNYKLEILHIINKETKAYLEEHKLKEAAIYDQLKEMSGEVADEHGIDVNFIVREGGVYKQIGEIAAEIGARLIVIGTHGKTGFQKITGSHALKVIEHSPVPVIVVQDRKFDLTESFKNIMLPVSLYAQVRQKASWASLIARSFPGVRVNIFLFYEEDSGRDYTQNVVTKQITEYFEKHKINYDIKIAQQDIKYGEQVLKYADHIDAGLIMIMTTQDRFFNLEYGDYDEKMMFNRFKIPTMFINPKFYDRIKFSAAWNER